MRSQLPDSRTIGRPSACPDAATLAAFVDGSLRADELQTVREHVETCPDCYQLIVEINATREELTDEEEEAEDAPVTPLKPRVRPQTTAVGIGVLLAAASIAFVVYSTKGPLDPLVSVVGESRFTAVRPTGGFQFGPLRTRDRGAMAGERLALTSEVERLRRQAASGRAVDLHAAGVAELVIGRTDDSVVTLEKARQLAPRDADVEADFAAALSTRYLDGGSAADLTPALEALDRAIGLAPKLLEPRFNRALVMERAERFVEARQAWTSYLALDPKSAWSGEAKRRLDALEKAGR